MKLYLIVNIIIGILGSILRAYYISKDEYPRNTETKIGTELFALLLGIGFIIWGGLLYWGVIK